MNKKTLIIFSVILGTAMLPAACGQQAEPTPTIDPNAIMTEVAMTVAAEVTQSALLTPSPTTALPPTATPLPLPTQNLTGIPTVAITVPAASNVAATQPVTVTGDNSAWVEDVTVPDGEIYYAREYFKKVWKVKNTGSTTWDSSYNLVNIDDNSWGEDVIIPLTTTVLPGAEVNLSVQVRAPSTLGEHFSRWFLRNPNGQTFGEELYIYITVGTEEDKTPTPSG
jgi:hypothetical protein